MVVTGPTASGKSGLALALAEALDGVVINADSMQVYRELEILTARPGADALARAPHRLYGSFPGSEVCSAGRWRALALTEIEAAATAGKLPILAGGTGFYLRALEDGLAEIPEIPIEIRDRARALHAAEGGAAFRAALAARDPVMAGRLQAADGQRLIRAWEVLEATGRSLADWQAEAQAEPAPYRFLHLALIPPRDRLYAACDRRFEEMVDRGAVDEVRRLLALGLDPALPVMKAVGVAELGAYLAGEIDRAEAVARAQQATRRYAKRQLTWLRTQSPLGASGAVPRADPEPVAAEAEPRTNPAWIVINQQYSESLDPKIFTIIRQFVLTPQT